MLAPSKASSGPSRSLFYPWSVSRRSRRAASLSLTTKSQAEGIYGLDVVVAVPCRCGCPLLRVHPYSVKSEIRIWKCVWCRKRRGRPTETELALMNAWLKEYGWTIEPLAFCDDGGIRF